MMRNGGNIKMTNLKKLILAGGLAGSLALTGCDNTYIKKVGDLTGDSIQDVLMYEDDFLASRRGNILYEPPTPKRIEEKKILFSKFTLSAFITKYRASTTKNVGIISN